MKKDKIADVLHCASGCIKVLAKYQEKQVGKWPDGVDDVLSMIQGALSETGKCGAVMAGPNRIVCEESKGHEGCHKSAERKDKFMVSQVHWDDSLCRKEP